MDKSERDREWIKGWLFGIAAGASTFYILTQVFG